jgi:hypothetical protein
MQCVVQSENSCLAISIGGVASLLVELSNDFNCKSRNWKWDCMFLSDSIPLVLLSMSVSGFASLLPFCFSSHISCEECVGKDAVCHRHWISMFDFGSCQFGSTPGRSFILPCSYWACTDTPMVWPMPYIFFFNTGGNWRAQGVKVAKEWGAIFHWN